MKTHTDQSHRIAVTYARSGSVNPEAAQRTVASQQRKLQQWAIDNGYTVVSGFADCARAVDSRSGFSDLLDLAWKQTSVDIIVECASRLTRSVDELEALQMLGFRVVEAGR